jgi:hypothetical protein
LAHGDSSQKIRQRAIIRFIDPARKRGLLEFSMPVKPLMTELEAEGFPKNRPAQFCSAIQKESFQAEQGFEVERIEGPESGKSTTVVLHCRFKNATGRKVAMPENAPESPSARALWVTEQLRGFLKKEIRALGGPEGYMKWVRREDEE